MAFSSHTGVVPSQGRPEPVPRPPTFGASPEGPSQSPSQAPVKIRRLQRGKTGEPRSLDFTR